MAKNGNEWLQTRIDELESGWVPGLSFATDIRLLRSVVVMSSWTSTRMTLDPSDRVLIDADAADEITVRCRLIREITQTDPDLVRGPLCQSRQCWIGTGQGLRMGTAAQRRSLTEQPPALRRAYFVEVNGSVATVPSTKPSRLGLYTSTVGSGGHSMWRVFLEFGTEASLHSRPWSVWELQPEPRGAKVFEINSARTWCAFVQRYARVAGELIYPDWPKVACDFDAVHMTLAAIVAAQGFNFPASPYVTAAAYWDVETTLWLRWRFASVRLLEIIR